MLSTHLAQSLSMPGPAVTMMTGLVRATSTATLTRRNNSLQNCWHTGDIQWIMCSSFWMSVCVMN